MKLNKNILLIMLAIVLFAVAGKIALISKARQNSLTETNRQVAAIKAGLAHIAAIKEAVFAKIPVNKGHLDNINTVVARGSVALYNLAQAHHLNVGILSIDSAAQSDIALDRIAKPLPMTNDTIKRITLLLKVNFTNLPYLIDFINNIPDTGGYLSNIKIKANSATLTVKFIGI